MVEKGGVRQDFDKLCYLIGIFAFVEGIHHNVDSQWEILQDFQKDDDESVRVPSCVFRSRPFEVCRFGNM